MNRLVLAVAALLAAVSIAGVSGLAGYRMGTAAERKDASAERRRAVERAELVAERKVSAAEDDRDAAIADVSRRFDARADEMNVWVQDYVKCITDLMTEDGTFFDTSGLTEAQAVARCNEETSAPPSRNLDE